MPDFLRDRATDADLDTLTAAGRGLPVDDPIMTAIRNEVSRRAEIRIMRAEFGGSHDAAWYEPRPQVQPMVGDDNRLFSREMHVECVECGHRPGNVPDCGCCQRAEGLYWAQVQADQEAARERSALRAATQSHLSYPCSPARPASCVFCQEALERSQDLAQAENEADFLNDEARDWAASGL
jgi:hypothetical protein